MGHRIIITENERKYINKLYGFINEGEGNAVKVVFNKLNGSEGRGKITKDIMSLLKNKVLPNVIEGVNKVANFQGTIQPVESTYNFGTIGKIKSASVNIRSLKAKSGPTDWAPGFDAECDISLKGRLGAYIDDTKTITDELNINVKANLSFIIDMKCGVNSEEDVKGVDNRYIQIDGLNLNLNLDKVNLNLLDDNNKVLSKVGSVKIENNQSTFSIPFFGITKSLDLDINNTIKTEIINNDELSLFKFKDHPEIIQNLPDFLNCEKYQ